MAECKYYREAVGVIDSRKISGDRMPDAEVIRAPWCAHPKHSRVNEWAAVGTKDGWKLLKCGGELAECPLTGEQFDDI